MSRNAKSSSVRLWKFPCTVTASILMLGCAQSMKPSCPPAQILAQCPATLGPLADNTFGATADKLVEVAGRYYRCRAAALACITPATESGAPARAERAAVPERAEDL